MEFWSYNEHFGPGEQWDAQYGKGFSQALIERLKRTLKFKPDAQLDLIMKRSAGMLLRISGVMH